MLEFIHIHTQIQKFYQPLKWYVYQCYFFNMEGLVIRYKINRFSSSSSSYYYYFQKSALQGWERVDAPYQSEDPNPIKPAHKKKEEKRINLIQWKTNRERADQANKNAFTLLLKPASRAPSGTLVGLRHIDWGLKWGLKVLRYWDYVPRRCIRLPMSNQGTTYNPPRRKVHRQCTTKWIHMITSDEIYSI